jgi:hypothetical protein
MVMRARTEFLMLGVLGILLISLSIYTAVGWTAQPSKWGWWSIVGIPFVGGIAYSFAAYFGSRKIARGKATLVFFIVCEACALALLPIGGYGIMATVFCGLLLLYVILKYRREVA